MVRLPDAPDVRRKSGRCLMPDVTTVDTFTSAINFVLAEEGGLTNDARDPGGLTNFGIDQQDHPDVDIRHLTRDDAIEIYRTSYWLKVRCDQLPPYLAVMHFDTAVNEGLGAAAELLQESVGATVDGHIGPKTLAAAHDANPRDAIDEYASGRMFAYGQMAEFHHDGRGWSRRLMACHRLCLGMVNS